MYRTLSLKLLKMEEEHDIVHFPQSYSRSISVRGVHAAQTDKIKSCPLQESLFHLELSQKNIKYSTTKHSSLKITIPLKYIKVWSLFPLGQYNYLF